MGKNILKPLFIPLLGCFFNRWVRISTETARIITRLCIGNNLGQLYDWGAIFFPLIKTRSKLFS